MYTIFAHTIHINIMYMYMFIAHSSIFDKYHFSDGVVYTTHTQTQTHTPSLTLSLSLSLSLFLSLYLPA